MCFYKLHFEKVVANMLYYESAVRSTIASLLESISHQTRVKCLIALMFLDYTRKLPDI